jgi:hypothetical protein
VSTTLPHLPRSRRKYVGSCSFSTRTNGHVGHVQTFLQSRGRSTGINVSRQHFAVWVQESHVLTMISYT